LSAGRNSTSPAGRQKRIGAQCRDLPNAAGEAIKARGSDPGVLAVKNMAPKGNPFRGDGNGHPRGARNCKSQISDVRSGHYRQSEICHLSSRRACAIAPPRLTLRLTRLTAVVRDTIRHLQLTPQVSARDCFEGPLYRTCGATVHERAGSSSRSREASDT
jgi:hypothetical protein